MMQYFNNFYHGKNVSLNNVKEAAKVELNGPGKLLEYRAISDFQKLVTTFLRSQFCRIKSKKIYYRNFKNFNEKNFLEEVKNTDFRFNSDDPNENYELITNVFSNIVEKHAPLKKKFFREIKHLP